MLKQRQVKTRIGAIILSLLMILGMLPLTAFAAPGAGLDNVYLGGAWDDGINDTNDGATAATAVKTFAKAKELVKDGGTIWLMGMYWISKTETWDLTDKSNVTLKRHFKASKDASSYSNRMLINVSAGTFTMKGVVIDATATTEQGAPNAAAKTDKVLGVSNNGAVIMDTGCIIKNNNAFCSGSAVQVSDSGSFTMQGNATIRNNSTDSGNSAGGIYLMHKNSTVTVKDTAVISGNSASSGGGIYSLGKLNILGGTITNNTAALYGGGIWANSGGALTITGNNTVISANTAAGGTDPSRIGHNVFINGATTTINGTWNRATGVFLNNRDTFPSKLTVTGAIKSTIALEGVYNPTGLVGTVVAQGDGYTLTETDRQKFTYPDSRYTFKRNTSNQIIIVEKTYDVDGDIIGADPNFSPTAILRLDGTTYNATVTKSGAQYKYHANVPTGQYNLIVTANIGGETVDTTVLVKVTNRAVVENVTIQKGFNSKVTFTGAGTPNIEAGGLDNIAETVGKPAENTHVLIELKVAKNDASVNADDVKKSIADDNMLNGVVMDTDLYKTVNKGTAEQIDQLDAATHGVDLIAVVFHLPENIQNKNGYAIYRYHGTQVDKITATPNMYGEYMTVDSDRTTITAHLNRFSTYAIAFSDTDENKSTALDVQAKVYDQTTGLYSLNIEWGNMKFAYKDTTTVWDPKTHAYVANTAGGSKEWTVATYLEGVNNKITVTNHSNAAVDAAFDYAMENAIFNTNDLTDTAVKGFFFDNNDKAKAAASILDNTRSVTNTLANSKINLASAVGTAVGAAPSGNVFFAFAGTPDVGKGAVLKDFTKVGVITVTISPVA